MNAKMVHQNSLERYSGYIGDEKEKNEGSLSYHKFNLSSYSPKTHGELCGSFDLSIKNLFTFLTQSSQRI